MPTGKELLRVKMSSHFRTTRKQLDISQEKMAELLDISTRSYNNLENGRNLCSAVVLLRFLQISGADTPELLKELEKSLTME